MAAEAGHTKEMQSVQVERGVRVLDSPGVVFDDEDQGASNILLRNVVKVDDIPDPIAVGGFNLMFVTICYPDVCFSRTDIVAYGT